MLVRNLVKTKIGTRNQMNMQEAVEIKTSKSFCKTDIDMAVIQKEETVSLASQNSVCSNLGMQENVFNTPNLFR